MKRTWRLVGGLGVALVIGACSQDGSGPGSSSGDGMTRVRLTDAPFPFDAVGSVEVFVVSVAVSPTADTGAGAVAQQWLSVAEPNRTFDLFSLRDGQTALLGGREIPASEYRALRMVIDVDASRIRWKDGSEARVNWQGTGRITLNALVERSILVLAGGGDIVIDFDVGRSFVQGFDPLADFLFIPWIRAVDEAGTGTISGTVVGPAIEGDPTPIADASISVFRADSQPGGGTLAASARSDADGRFIVSFLAAGRYVVRVDAPIELAFAPAMIPVTLAAGDGLELGIVLERISGGPQAGVLRISGSPQMTVGEVATFFAVIFDEDGDSVLTDDVTWWSSNPDVASITLPVGGAGSQMAQVTARALGGATIFASSGALWDSLLLMVNADEPGGPVATVELSPERLTIAVGDTAAVVVTLRDAEGRVLTDRTVEWTTSNAAIVRIDGTWSHGVLLTATGAGVAAITATSEGKSASAEVTVTP